jgi:hypothetical protein
MKRACPVPADEGGFNSSFGFYHAARAGGRFPLGAIAHLASGINLRRYIPIALCSLLPLTARANPVILDPSSLIAFGVVAFWALVIEAAVVALLLTFSGLAPLRIFGGFFVTNLAVFCFFFYPLLRRIPLPALEALVVAVDGAAIKLLSSLGSFQQDEFRGVTWLRAGLVALVGNVASFFVGVIASGSPWEKHTVDD